MRTMAVAAALSLASCAGFGSPERLAAPVADFHKAVADTQAAMDAGLANLQADNASNQTARFLRERPRLKPSAACAVSENLDGRGVPLGVCTLVADADPSDVRPTPALRLERSNREKTAALLRYAAALQELVDAESGRQLQTATDRLALSAGAVAAAAGPQGVAAVPVVMAAIKAAGTGLALYDANRRYQALRTAVTAIDGHVGVVATSLGTYLDAVRGERIEVLFQDARTRATAVRGPGESPAAKDYEARLPAAMARPATIAELQKASGSEAGQAIKAAHSALVAAVVDPAAGAADLVGAMDRLTEATAALRRAMAAKTTTGG